MVPFIKYFGFRINWFFFSLSFRIYPFFVGSSDPPRVFLTYSHDIQRIRLCYGSAHEPNPNGARSALRRSNNRIHCVYTTVSRRILITSSSRRIVLTGRTVEASDCKCVYIYVYNIIYCFEWLIILNNAVWCGFPSSNTMIIETHNQILSFGDNTNITPLYVTWPRKFVYRIYTYV